MKPRPGRAALALVVAACGHGGACDGRGADATGAIHTSPPASAAEPSTTSAAPASAATDATSTAATIPAASAAPEVAWAQKLSPLLFRDVNTLADVALRLYRPDGTLDDEAAAEVERVLWASKDEAPVRVSRRLLQLVVKVAAHFDAHEVQVISSHRGKASKGSRHRSGEAIDFVFPGVPAKKLAEVLRTYARVGVGLYVHPRSQYVHLDVRQPSYHWIDGSPPGRSWKEHGVPDPTAAARDAAHTPADDLPITTGAPATAATAAPATAAPGAPVAAATGAPTPSAARVPPR